MKKGIARVTVLSVVLLLNGCIPSVNPFYTERDRVFEPALLGQWQDNESGDAWQFESVEDKAYKLTMTDSTAKQGEFAAILFKLEQHYFLDLVPSDCDFATNQVEMVAAAMFPGHLLMRITQFEPTLKLAFMDYDWLQKHLESNPGTVAHRRDNDRILLTAETLALQEFVLKHLAAEELFQAPSVMVRKEPEQNP